jgi:transposase
MEMAHFFRKPDRRQRFLLPVDMMDWLPEDDIVHLIGDAVGLMDLSGLEATCKVGHAGQPPFAPALLLALLIYAYSQGVRSSRRIERLCRRDAGYRFIVGDEVPDHTVIARFRQRHVGRMKSVFLQVLELCREAGLIRLALVALDGTKVEANAALDANRTASTIEEQISRMLAEAEATDAREDRQFGPEASGPAMPKELGRHADRLARLKACQEKLESRAAAAAACQQEKLAARQAEEKATGKRKRGRKPKEPDPSGDPNAVANPTDPDSGMIMMKTRRGWVQGYNAQAVVTPEQIILAADSPACSTRRRPMSKRCWARTPCSAPPWPTRATGRRPTQPARPRNASCSSPPRKTGSNGLRCATPRPRAGGCRSP